jgi:hypothetical protein
MSTYKRNYEKIRRNDICPCGSELKYKNCCLPKREKLEQNTFEYFYNREREDVDSNADVVDNDRNSIVLPDTRIIMP